MTASHRSRRVLLIEDDLMDALLVIRALNSLATPVRISHVEDGASALLELIKETPDVVICDLNLPKLGGKEVLRHFRNIARFDNVPFLILSSSENAQDVSDCLCAGSNGYIAKPIDSEVYLKEVQAVTEQLIQQASSSSPLGKFSKREMNR